MADEPASRTAPSVDAKDLRGFKQLRRVAGLLSFLHESGCTRDKAGNRDLHFDDYVLLNLLYLFNPLLESMSLLQKASDLTKVQEQLRQLKRTRIDCSKTPILTAGNTRSNRVLFNSPACQIESRPL